MNNLKVWTFHPVARNALLFVLLSFFFIVLQKSLHSNLPFMNRSFLEKVFFDEWPLLVIALPAVLMIFRHQGYSRYAFTFFCAAVMFRSLEGLFLDFNKILMVVLFIYVCLAYTFYQLLKWTFSRAVFTPNYPQDILTEPMSHKIHAVLVCGDISKPCLLTNWDSEGAFIYLHEEWPAKVKSAELSIKIGEHSFAAKGSVVAVTWDNRGIGVEWNNTHSNQGLPWKSLVTLFDDLGWSPQLLR
jgi:hypothetical protein